MGKKINKYFTIINLDNLLFVGNERAFVQLEDALKFETEQEARDFMSNISIKNREEYTIYEVSAIISFKRVCETKNQLHYEEGVR